MPVWEVGHFWKWKLEGAGASLEATTVVVSEDASSYNIGSSDTAAAAFVFPFHIVGLDAVSKSDLSWNAHGTSVKLLDFPMADKKTWTADFWNLGGAEVKASAAKVAAPGGQEDGFHIVVSYPGATGGGPFMDADWSAQRGQFTRVSTFFGADQPFATATLTGEGNGTTDAKPFVATELVRWSATPAAPTGLAPHTFNVGDDATQVLLACFLGGAQGHFQANMVLADRTQAACQATMPTGVEYHASVIGAVPGQGEVIAAPLGIGGVTVEIFAIAAA